MSKYPIEAVQPKVKKAGSTLHEDRDTNHPGMVSELFIGFLKSVGEPVRCPSISKNMRDDVLWADARSPWRRSPSWLVIRVALQLSFNRKSSARSGIVYKEAMLFVLCNTLTLATNHSLSSNELFSMSAKLARRLLKIGPEVNKPVKLFVQSTLESAHAKISERWSAIQKLNSSKINVTELSSLNFTEDCHVPIPELDKYITWMSARKREQCSSIFQPQETLIVFSPDNLPLLPSAFPKQSNAITNLEAFETWVALHSRKWGRDNQSTACYELSSLIMVYHNLAVPYYSKNPEALSTMLLTIFELWVACDEVATLLCPLLSKYDPDIPSTVLQNLLLPFASQMRRLHCVERYLTKRYSLASFPSTELFYDLESPKCFPVQYFSSSEAMQQTYTDIMKAAQKKREEKLLELRNLKTVYDGLMARSNQMQCEYEEVLVDYHNNIYESRHNPNCKKCANKNKAANLEIHLDEWPLPRSITKAKSIVFEKKIPPYLQSWRQARFYVLKDVIGMQYSVKSAPCSFYALPKDPHLPSGPSRSSQIGLLSEEKPQVVTHRTAQKVSTATKSSVCVNNGLNYRYFDFVASRFVADFEPSENVLEMCTYHLPTESKSLQTYLDRPATSPDGPGSNVALANQSEIPAHMSIEEARDLAMLPLGHRIQLHNILIQLATPSLDFRKHETAIFILQCLYQSGPSGNTYLRAGYAIVECKQFAEALLDNLATAWQKIKENWESAQALSTFAAITTRLLSLSSYKNVQKRCIKFLTDLRTGAFAWVELLRDRSHEATAQSERTYFKSKSVDVALICVSCFDVEECFLVGILESKSDTSIFVQCSIIIQEGKPEYSPASELTLACLSLRFRRLLYRSLPILSKTHSGVSDAVQKSWSAYRKGGGWRVVCTHWLVCETAPSKERAQVQVHYNMLSGELLVNGTPLGCPPREYQDHPMWHVLFNQNALEVMPTSAAAMEFSAKRQYKGYEVRFGRKGTTSGGMDLLVQASRVDADYETIPSRLLQGLFPDHFVNDFVHWYNYTNDILEFRPREAPWESNNSQWVLHRSPKGWTLGRGGSLVVGAKSRTATAVTNVLLPLADKLQIHSILHPSDETLLEVELPALRLGFSLTAGKSSLRSREFPGMAIDGDQSIGTLTGLLNKLILKDHNRRLILVPEGQVSWVSANGHIQVTVSKPSITQVHPLYVDSVLGRLTDNGNLEGKLFISYLHALTSYCLPDPFTNRTGVEQALAILNSAAVRSFDRLSQKALDTMLLVAQLCPTRQYYPRQKRVMQTVLWKPNLSFLSHHEGFYKAVNEIFEHASQMCLFYPGLESKQLDLSSQIDTNAFLMDRNRIRMSTFWVSGFGAEEHNTVYDDIYRSRDRDQSSARGTNAYVLSSIVYRNHTRLHTDVPQVGKLWEIMLNVPKVLSPYVNIDISELQYSADAANSGLDLSRWLSLHRILSTQSVAANKFSVMIWLSAIAAHKQADLGLLQIMALFFTAHELRNVELPLIQSCYPPKGYEPTSKHLQATLRSYDVGLNASPEAQLRANPGEDWRNLRKRRKKSYATNKNFAICALTQKFMSLWPRETLPALGHVDSRISGYLKLNEIESAVRQQFEEWFSNLRLFEYLQNVERALSRFGQSPIIPYQPELVILTSPAANSTTRSFVSVKDLFTSPEPSLPTQLPELEIEKSTIDNEKRALRLPGILDTLKERNAQSLYEMSYIKELDTSMRSLQTQQTSLYSYVRDRYFTALLRQYMSDCEQTAHELYLHLVTACTASSNGISEFGHGPRLSPLLFLQQLGRGAWDYLSPDWRVCVTRYGLALAALQRAQRLIGAAGSLSDEELIKELENIGHRTWSPLDHPEWLLLEVESGIMIRDVQERIAVEMINPRSHSNAILQLNMGEGKSSVIVPMVATELANGSQLARVIVAKPQSKQMAQMLISKLGGLLDRRVYYMPFSRALKVNSTTLVNSIDKMVRNCQRNGGVLLVQPEHILSFQLMGVECYCDKQVNRHLIGESFIRLQEFFDKNSRDIVDESDENFSPKFELVYTMGSQQSIELSPARWICMQQVLSLVRILAVEIPDELPKSLEIDLRDEGGFPRLRILKLDAAELLVKRVARCICNTGLDGFPIARQQEHIRDAVFKYISQYNLSPQEIRAVEESGDGRFWTESTKPFLLLLRGILAGGILTFALSRKRWRVDYGLATDRIPPTKLAVPYRAKDNPTPRSEFSHPDVVIALTSLTYYYGGLEDEDLFIALGNLMESDQASIEYDTWMKDSGSMPVPFRQLEGINLKDRAQCINDIFPHLRYGKSVVDYFLGHVVFPKEVKEFPYKLSASGWDLGKRKSHCTTGFSGTNDSRKVLPLDIKQLDLPSQMHTNALVLEYLLQPENSVALLPDRPALAVTDAQRILDKVIAFKQPVRVILDVGAQILELNNRQVAESWLHMVRNTEVQATVFVNDDDELSVIDRQGNVELLQTSSYATRLNACLVFLDEAHTRGIDLKLPDDYRAAVTLGANLTKDRLVQACMRLRKLGRGQSVVFCVSAEIQDKIQRATGMPPDTPVEVKDVLHWAISETFAETHRSMPLWAAQGARFIRQEELWKSTQANGSICFSSATAKQFLDDEAQPIEVRYRPRHGKSTPLAGLLGTETPRLHEIKERWSEFAYLDFNSSTLEEEQERELCPEIEQERQVQRPAPARPASHDLHPDLIVFVNTGNLNNTSKAYFPAFNALRGTSAAKSFKTSQLDSNKLSVTNDFAQTVVASNITHVSDSYLRPVQWILSSCAKGSTLVDVLIIISPHEAEELMPLLQSTQSKRVTLHLYKPRCVVGHRSLDQLDFFTIPYRQLPLVIPSALKTPLNLFAGQLYFDTYVDYLNTCKFLGLATGATKQGEVVDADGYILRDANGKSRFDKSPVQFFKILTSKIRRNGQDISKTHVGSMLDGKLLQKSDFEE
ncbi:hypothetical protein F5B22DRAFT_639075 [Xylaria bambusicola]|uniref:uncharacterized protein n=1 Tax=Xylaria bambusicola TaxID=326684 RepID=UPI0020088380|nr:uncharacterized protein F5B22DRAFT_639075 [Xylaria bambusicola]KAI0506704.1 hypothetical protein F5B22DRAFT_639075 [Xylaria bambusicola]